MIDVDTFYKIKHLYHDGHLRVGQIVELLHLDVETVSKWIQLKSEARSAKLRDRFGTVHYHSALSGIEAIGSRRGRLFTSTRFSSSVRLKASSTNSFNSVSKRSISSRLVTPAVAAAMNSRVISSMLSRNRSLTVGTGRHFRNWTSTLNPSSFMR